MNASPCGTGSTTLMCTTVPIKVSKTPHLFLVCLLAGRHHPRAVNEVNLLHERDVLPHLRLAGNGGHVAHLLGAERVDHAGLAGVGVANEAHRDLLGLLVQLAQLAEQVDKRALPEGMMKGGVEGNGWIFLKNIGQRK